jgi:hypothetical protein
MRASAHDPFVRLSRLLGCAAVAGQGPAQRVRQGRRVTRVATSAGRTRTARATPSAAASRSCVARGARSTAPAAASPRTGGDATDAFALAPGACASEVGAAAAGCRPSADRRSRARTRSTARAREPSLRLPADRRRVAEARPARLAEHGQADPAYRRFWAGAAALGAELAAVPATAGCEHARLRLLHRRDDLAAPLLRPLFHRTREPPGAPDGAAPPIRPAPG